MTTVSYSPHLLTTHPSVPVKTTRDLIALAKANPGKLNGEMLRILALPDIKDKLGTQGTVPVTNSPQDTAKWIAAENARYAKLIKETGFKLN